MEKMLGSMLKEFFSNMSKEDKQKMMSRFEKMAEMCPCMNGETTEEDRRKMMEKMFSCCK